MQKIKDGHDVRPYPEVYKLTDKIHTNTSLVSLTHLWGYVQIIQILPRDGVAKSGESAVLGTTVLASTPSPVTCLSTPVIDNFFLSLCVCSQILFLSNPYTHQWVRTHNPKTKSCVLHQLSQLGIPRKRLSMPQLPYL